MARLPLEGVRVLDLTVVWAGPWCTMLLGDLGAEVIRLDNPYLFPSSTKGFAPRVSKEMAEALGPIVGAFPDKDPGERPWNRHAMFNCHARGKRMATVDLSKDSGREAVLRLVEASDVLVENNAARVLDKLGIGWDVLHARNPRFILLRMPPMGLTGPYHDFVGFGAHFEAVSGLTAVRGYRDADPTSTTSVFHMDPASGATGAFAIMAALRRRERTGEGCFIELPQAENVMQQIGELFVDAARTGRAHEPLGNRHPTRAPQGCYPCAGEDRWAVISVGSDQEWSGLRKAMGDPEWAAEARFATAEGRRDAHDELDDRISSWTSGVDPYDVFHRCQAEGVPAGPVMTEADAFVDPHLRDRGFFRENVSSDAGTHDYPSHLWHWTGPEMNWGPIAGMGQDNQYVWREVAGLSEAELEQLDAEGHLSLDYLAPDGTPL
ncbi:MAG: CoA transferase [Acidimicrobiales bacterium]|nr:CoA transferase [Acidimicrobiales bacterium]